MDSPRDHPITIEPNPNRVRVLFNGRVVADTTRALTLKEASLPAVHYIPREDADLSLLEPTAPKTHCPDKSDAAYYTIRVAGRTAENAVWMYEDPYPAVAAIKGPSPSTQTASMASRSCRHDRRAVICSRSLAPTQR